MTQSNGQAEEDEEDDYMNMSFADPTPARETLTEKKKRLAREAEVRGKPKSKAELASEEKAKREAALSNKEIDTTSKGFKMMAALGYKPGSALGAARNNEQSGKDERLLEPVGVEMKEGRSGIGADAEKKRKFREEVAAREEDFKRKKVEETDFRERQQREREEKKMEAQVHAAMKVCERLEEEDDAKASAVNLTAPPRKSGKPLHSINVLWRGLVKERAIRDRDKRMRHDLQTSLSNRPTYDDPEEDKDDKIALSRKDELEVVDIDLDQEDEELDDFNALEVAEKLQKLVHHLRQHWHYCFWCKYRYSDETMDGCPGLTEDDHD